MAHPFETTGPWNRGGWLGTVVLWERKMRSTAAGVDRALGRVLVGVDGSAVSRLALRWAVEQAWPTGAVTRYT